MIRETDPVEWQSRRIQNLTRPEGARYIASIETTITMPSNNERAEMSDVVVRETERAPERILVTLEREDIALRVYLGCLRVAEGQQFFACVLRIPDKRARRVAHTMRATCEKTRQQHTHTVVSIHFAHDAPPSNNWTPDLLLCKRMSTSYNI